MYNDCKAEKTGKEFDVPLNKSPACENHTIAYCLNEGIVEIRFLGSESKKFQLLCFL